MSLHQPDLIISFIYSRMYIVIILVQKKKRFFQKNSIFHQKTNIFSKKLHFIKQYSIINKHFSRKEEKGNNLFSIAEPIHYNKDSIIEIL